MACVVFGLNPCIIALIERVGAELLVTFRYTQEEDNPHPTPESDLPASREFYY